MPQITRNVQECLNHEVIINELECFEIRATASEWVGLYINDICKTSLLFAADTIIRGLKNLQQLLDPIASELVKIKTVLLKLSESLFMPNKIHCIL